MIFPLRKVEELNFPSRVIVVGGKKITLLLSGSFPQKRPKIIKGAPYRFSVSFSSPQSDEIESLSVTNLSIAAANDTTARITLEDKIEKRGDLNYDKAYYWSVGYDGLSVPEGAATLRCEIRVVSKGRKVERENVEWILLPERKEYYVNTILEAIKGI